MYILLSLFYTSTYIKFPPFLHVWLVYVLHFLQYLYSSHPRHILFHYVIHGFSTVGLCCNIKLAIFTAQCYPNSKIPSLFRSNSVNLAPNHCHNITHKKRNVLPRLKTGRNAKKRIMWQKKTCVTPTLSFHTHTHTHTHARTQDEELFVSQSTSHYVFHKKSVGIPLIKFSDNFVHFQISLRTKIFFSWTWSMSESYFDHGSVT